MNQYVILYRTRDTLPCDPPLPYVTSAANSDVAEEECIAAIRNGCRVAWVWEGGSVSDALDDFFAAAD